MATRRCPATERPSSAPLSGLELARAKAWHAERPHSGPPPVSAAVLARKLQEQAQEHGLADYSVDAATADELFDRDAGEQDDKARKEKVELQSFAGLRPADRDDRCSLDSAATGNGDQECGLSHVGSSAVIELFRSLPQTIQSAEQLEAAGLDLLKAELDRLGLKCGGSLRERAQRLFLTKDRPRELWPKEIIAKRRRGGGGGRGDSVDGARKRPQLGPARPKPPPAARPAPRGQGAGAIEMVGVWRPNV